MHLVHVVLDLLEDSEFLRNPVALHDSGGVIGSETKTVLRKLRFRMPGVLNEVEREHIEDE